MPKVAAPSVVPGAVFFYLLAKLIQTGPISLPRM